MAQVTIDLVSEHKERNELILRAIETRDWRRASIEQLREVQDKIYGYLDAIEQGVVSECFPGPSGRKICIQLDHLEELDQVAFEFLNRLSTEVQKSGIEFRLHRLNGLVSK